MTQNFVNDNITLILIMLTIDATLKAVAMWMAAQKGAKVWFVLLFILNTAGILPLFYIFYFSKQQKPDNKN